MEVPKVLFQMCSPYIVTHHISLCTLLYTYSCHCRFSEFVDYVLGKDLRYDDEHWSPYYKECTPCHINFTFVGQSTPEKSPRLSVRIVGNYAWLYGPV